MKSLLISLILLFSFVDAAPLVLVSIAPQKFFVEQIAKNTVEVQVLVPSGASPHSFEPTPKQMMRASLAEIWFRIGEPFEMKAIEVLKSHRPSMRIIDTRKGVPLLGSSCHCSEDFDTHIWLSPKLVKIQIKTIQEALSAQFPEHASFYEKRAEEFLEQLEELDKELTDLFKEAKDRVILVSHPAFAYLCQDYGIKQLSIEVEGKDPSSKKLTNLLNEAKKEGIARVFTQEQYQNKGAHLIAKELKAEIYSVDPYSEDYLNNIRRMGRLFSGHAECN